MPIELERIPLPRESLNPKYEYYVLSESGRCPALDFLGSLGQDDRDAFYSKFYTAGERGIEKMRPQSFKKLTGYKGIYEFKTWSGQRLTCFFDGTKCVLVEGWKKGSNKATNEEKRFYARAEKRRDDYLQEKER